MCCCCFYGGRQPGHVVEPLERDALRSAFLRK
jgi:hypothetical protein